MYKCTNAQMHKCTGTLTPDFGICQFCPKSASQPPSSPPPLDPSERVRRIAPLSCPCPAQPSSMDARICHAIHTKYQSTCDKLAYILFHLHIVCRVPDDPAALPPHVLWSCLQAQTITTFRMRGLKIFRGKYELRRWVRAPLYDAKTSARPYR